MLIKKIKNFKNGSLVYRETKLIFKTLVLFFYLLATELHFMARIMQITTE